MDEIVLFDYYGLRVLFMRSDRLPLHVYAFFNDTGAMAEILFSKGIHVVNKIKAVEGKRILEDTELGHFHKILERYLPEILKAWQDVFIYGKSLKTEIIMEKL